LLAIGVGLQKLLVLMKSIIKFNCYLWE